MMDKSKIRRMWSQDKITMSKKRLFIVFFIQFFLLGTGSSIVGPLIPVLSNVFMVKLDIVGSTLSLNAFGILIATISTGIISERFGKRNIAVFGSILFVLSFLVLFFAENFLFFTIIYFIYGISWGAISVNATSIISDCFASSRSKSIIRLNLGFLLGQAFAPLVVSGVLFFDLNWRYIFLFLAALNLVLTILILLIKNEFLNKKGKGENFIVLLSHNRRFISDPVIILCGIIALLHFGTGFSFNAWFTNYFESINIPVTSSSLILSLNFFMLSAGLIFKSYFVTRFGNKRMMLLSSITAFIFLLIAFIIDNLILKIIFVSLFGFSFSAIAAIALSLAIKQYTRYSGSITSIINSFAFLGVIIFQYTAGYLSQNHTSAGVFYTSLAALFLISVLTIILVRIYNKARSKKEI